MTKDDIITEISKSDQWPGICRKIAKGNEIYQDLFQEFIIALIDIPEAKLVALKESGELQWYGVRMLLIMYNSSNTPFFRRYRALMDMPCIQPDEYDHSIDLEYERVEKLLQELPWYEREIFRQYVKVGSYRKLSKATGIVAQSIAATVNKVKRKIRTQTTTA